MSNSSYFITIVKIVNQHVLIVDLKEAGFACLTQKIGSAREEERFFSLGLSYFRFCGKIPHLISRFPGRVPILYDLIEISTNA